MKNTDLKPCPFCGSEAIQETYEEYYPDSSWDEFECVHCTGCGATIEGETKEEVIEAWNRRV